MKDNNVYRYLNIETPFFDKAYVITDNSIKRMFKTGEFPPLDIQNWRFGFLLGSYRRDKAITIQDLSDLSGIDASIISKVENGKMFNEKLVKYYLSNCSENPLDDITFIINGEVD